MQKVKIVTDSSCSMEPGIAEKLNIEIVSLSVMIDSVSYKDSDLPGEEFMKMMAESKSLPKTSQPPIGEFVELYDKLGADGSAIVSIHLTEVLSGTVNAARQAAEITNSDVTVIDSTFTDQGLAFQVIEAAELAQKGGTKEEVIAKVEEVRANSRLYIGVSSLDNLVKGGRVSRATGLITSFFNIRVVMELTTTELVTMAKGRGAKTFSRWFDELLTDLKKGPTPKRIGVTHADGIEIAEGFKAGLQELYPDVHIPVLQTRSIIATHTGKGAFAVMIYT